MKSGDRYSTINLLTGFFDDDILVDFFVHGRFDREQVRVCLGRRQPFVNIADLPAWQVVSGFSRYEDSEVEDAVKRMEGEFTRREFMEPGEMLRVFALRLLMASKGVSKLSVSEELKECKKYVDELKNMGKLIPIYDQLMEKSYVITNSWDGVGFYVANEYEIEFDEIKKHLIDARREAFRYQKDDILSEIIEALRNDSDRFYCLIAPRDGIEQKYLSIPIFADIDVSGFVDEWMGSPKAHWGDVAEAFKNRYSEGALKGPLREEVNWVRALVNELSKRADGESGFPALRIGIILRKIEDAVSRLPSQSPE